MLTPRYAQDRGQTVLSWLDSRHSFSFGSYHDPRHTQHSALVVINDDKVRAHSGFGTHPHRHMEILTWMLSGQLDHRDSMGHSGRLLPGDAQLMSAGPGIQHSEMNEGEHETHFLQIWILPREKRSDSSYQQIHLPSQPGLTLIASGAERHDAMLIHQDVAIWRVSQSGRGHLTLPQQAQRQGWLQMIDGEADVAGITLRPGDGLAISDEEALTLHTGDSAELLWFDLP